MGAHLDLTLREVELRSLDVTQVDESELRAKPLFEGHTFANVRSPRFLPCGRTGGMTRWSGWLHGQPPDPLLRRRSLLSKVRGYLRSHLSQALSSHFASPLHPEVEVCEAVGGGSRKLLQEVTFLEQGTGVSAHLSVAISHRQVQSGADSPSSQQLAVDSYLRPHRAEWIDQGVMFRWLEAIFTDAPMVFSITSRSGQDRSTGHGGFSPSVQKMRSKRFWKTEGFTH